MQAACWVLCILANLRIVDVHLEPGKSNSIVSGEPLRYKSRSNVLILWSYTSHSAKALAVLVLALASQSNRGSLSGALEAIP